tara:strand:+ start:20329 stop:21492 length:1164 start_codon:yes stop_codon:yes gene_type:complete
MELNLAFSTVFYISIFIIPGLIFRRIYFSGEFNKQFSQGNLLERIVWSILTSGIILVICAILLLFAKFNIDYQNDIIPQIKYTDIQDVFNSVGDNKLPTEEMFFKVYIDIFKIIGFLYIISFSAAVLFKWLIIYFGLDRSIKFLRFNNYWYYFMRGKAPHLDKKFVKKHWFTLADIMVDNGNDGVKMYSGTVVDYFIDRSTNQLDVIFLKDTSRYKFLTNSEEEKRSKDQVEVKNRRKYDLIKIPGNTFCIPFQNVHNLNLTYISKNESKKSPQYYINLGRRLVFAILFLTSIFLSFLDDLLFSTDDDWLIRSLFFVNTFLIILILDDAFIKLYKNFKLRELLGYTYIIGLFGVQYLWIFDQVSFVWVIPITFIVTYIIASTLKLSK